MTPGQNRKPFDQWTAVHLLFGAGARLIGLRLAPTFVAGLVYEGAEQVFERTRFGQRFFRISGPESIANVAGDMVALTMGWSIADALLAKRIRPTT